MVVLNTVRKPQEEIILLRLLTLSFALKTSLLHKICSNHGREYFLPLWKGNLGHNTKTYRKKKFITPKGKKNSTSKQSMPVPRICGAEQTCPLEISFHRSVFFFFFYPLTPMTSLVILFTVWLTILLMSIWRIWYWIN